MMAAMRALDPGSRPAPEPALYARQRQALALLDAFGGSLSRRDFQKLLFLYSQERRDNPPYEFVPYHYGAFSFTSYADRRRLIEVGLITDTDDWTLTEAGHRIGCRERDMITDEFARNNKLRGNALVVETYRRYPYYAINSKIMSSAAHIDESIPDIVEATRPSTEPGTLFTIGYQSRSLDSYLNCLIRVGVTLLCDVRRNPVSRKYGFSKRRLCSSCQRVGIRYEHLPGLGVPSERRRKLTAEADFDALFKEYRIHSLPCHETEILRIVGWLERGESVALTCFERHHAQCHRHCVAEAVESSSVAELATTHL
jgi:uncharacterized protein (DUF488 family)